MIDVYDGLYSWVDGLPDWVKNSIVHDPITHRIYMLVKMRHIERSQFFEKLAQAQIEIKNEYFEKLLAAKMNCSCGMRPKRGLDFL
jgi:hypothetical protein